MIKKWLTYKSTQTQTFLQMYKLILTHKLIMSLWEQIRLKIVANCNPQIQIFQVKISQKTHKVLFQTRTEFLN